MLFVVGFGLILDATSALEALHLEVTHPRIGSQAISLTSLYFLFFAFLSGQRFVIIANGDTIGAVLVEENANGPAQMEASDLLALL